THARTDQSQRLVAVRFEKVVDGGQILEKARGRHVARTPVRLAVPAEVEGEERQSATPTLISEGQRLVAAAVTAEPVDVNNRVRRPTRMQVSAHNLSAGEADLNAFVHGGRLREPHKRGEGTGDDPTGTRNRSAPVPCVVGAKLVFNQFRDPGLAT